MSHQMAVVFVIALLPAAHGFRRRNRASLETATQVGQDLDTGTVDFSFMTTDYRYPGHEAGFFGTISEFFGGRSVSEAKEEIVQGHFCQKRGSRDETYFASSFCYWLPEFEYANRFPWQRKNGTIPKNSGLLWQGGNYPQGKSLGMLPYSRGKCMRLSVCHNNAQGEEGDVDKVGYPVEVALPEGCMKEEQINKHCVHEYNTGVGADLSTRTDACMEVQSRYDTALEKHNNCVGYLESLPRQIAQYPTRIRRAEDNVVKLRAEVDFADRHERDERREMVRRCDHYERQKGWHRLSNWGNGATSTEQMLSFSTHCSYPHRPIDNGNGHHFDEMNRYRSNMELYEACKECKRAKDDLRRANSKTKNAEDKLRRARDRPAELQRERTDKERQLADWRQRAPRLRSAKEQMDGVWLPQKDSCLSTYKSFNKGKAGAVAACAPKFYKDSCERACVELQAKDGCGVVEGTQPGDATGMGGVSVQCMPPQPSWILTPFTHIDIQAEGRTEQCKRIEENQKVRYAQRVLKAGWLWKKGRINGWDKRYFVLQSGDDVRSALLRYFDKDAAKDSSADEQESKAIILRDAKNVKAKDAKRYGFKDGEECFKLYHFYRDYRFCVVASEDHEPSKGATPLDQRDEWLELLKENIGSE